MPLYDRQTSLQGLTTMMAQDFSGHALSNVLLELHGAVLVIPLLSSVSSA